MNNALLKQYVSLKQKKYRSEYGLFAVEGRKMTEELLKSSYELQSLCATRQWIDDNRHLLQTFCVEDSLIEEISARELEKLSSLTTPDGVFAVVRQKIPQQVTVNNNLIVALDDINNPGNLGTIIRLAAWFGVKDIVCSENTVDCYNPKVLQSTMGAIFHTNIFYTDLKAFLQTDNTVEIYGTVLQNGKNIYKETLSQNGIIVIGNESHGISKEILQYINRPVTIPSFADKDAVESLNASVACGIILSEFKRR